MRASQLQANDKFKLIDAHVGLEAGFMGIYTGNTEHYDDQNMLCVIGDDDDIPYLIRRDAEVELLWVMVQP